MNRSYPAEPGVARCGTVALSWSLQIINSVIFFPGDSRTPFTKKMRGSVATGGFTVVAPKSRKPRSKARKIPSGEMVEIPGLAWHDLSQDERQVIGQLREAFPNGKTAVAIAHALSEATGEPCTKAEVGDMLYEFLEAGYVTRSGVKPDRLWCMKKK